MKYEVIDLSTGKAEPISKKEVLVMLGNNFRHPNLQLTRNLNILGSIRLRAVQINAYK